MFGGVGIYEIAVIAGIAIVVFGASRIPKIARSLGEGIREFKETRKEITDDVEKSLNDKPGEAPRDKPDEKKE